MNRLSEEIYAACIRIMQEEMVPAMGMYRADCGSILCGESTGCTGTEAGKSKYRCKWKYY